MVQENVRKDVEASRGSALWDAYWVERTPEARNALIMHFLPLVKFTALRLANRCGPMGEVDDLFQHGIFGLKDAIGKFDRSRGVKFETYCMTRVRGAMLDGLKSQQWLPRDMKQKVNRYQEVRGRLFMEEGVAGSDEMIAERLGICPQMASADGEPRGGVAGGESARRGPTREKRTGSVRMRSCWPTRGKRSRRNGCSAKMCVCSSCGSFRKVQRQVMMLYYYEEMTMREIGETLGISATRVSQMHTEIIERLHERAGSLERAGCRMV